MFILSRTVVRVKRFIPHPISSEGVFSQVIYKWIYGKSNPNDLETVKNLAIELGIYDYKHLLKK